MPTTVNRVPFGLQDLLGNTGFGKNPGEFADTINPTLEMLPFWLGERHGVTAKTSALTTRGEALIITVPDGKLWMPHSMHIGIVGGITVGDIMQFTFNVDALPIEVGITSFIRLRTTDLYTVVTVGDLQYYDYQFPFRHVALAGRQFAMQIAAMTLIGIATTIEFSVVYDELDM